MWTVNFKVKETGHLTWALRKKSFSLIVFDESHKPYSCGRLLITFHLGEKNASLPYYHLSSVDARSFESGFGVSGKLGLFGINRRNLSFQMF